VAEIYFLIALIRHDCRGFSSPARRPPVRRQRRRRLTASTAQAIKYSQRQRFPAQDGLGLRRHAAVGIVSTRAGRRSTARGCLRGPHEDADAASPACVNGSTMTARSGRKCGKHVAEAVRPPDSG